MDAEAADPLAVVSEGPLQCPVCGEWTDSLKQYRCIDWCLFLLLSWAIQPVVYRACPECMRRFLWQRGRANILSANLLWPFVVLPWCLVLVAASRRRGHSRAVIEGITPQMAVDRETAKDKEIGRWVMLGLGLALFWFPLLGLVLAVCAYLFNREATDWASLASKILMTASIGIHVFLLLRHVAGNM